MTTDTNQPSDAEKKWTYRNSFYGEPTGQIILKPNGSFHFMVDYEWQAKEICDCFNELDRIKQAAKDVVSDEEIYGEADENCKPKAYPELWAGFVNGAQWMRDKLSPVIASIRSELSRLQAENEWISVKDRLPKDSDGKILAWEYAGNPIVTRAREEDGRFSERFSHWKAITPPSDAGKH